MNKLQLANLPLEPSRICLGSQAFGSTLSREQSFALMNRYVELGGNFLDTAHIYAAWLPGGEGASETTIGAWLKARGRREQLVLATKGAHPTIASGSDLGRCAPEEIRQDLNESLERLGVSVIDLYWLHRDEPARPIEEIVETMAGLIREGLIRSYGCSNWTLLRLQAANEYAAKQGLPGFAASQMCINLASELSDIPVGSFPVYEKTAATLAWHTKTSLPLMAYTSQAGGYFGEENVTWAEGGFIGEPPRGGQWDSPGNRRRLQRAMALAEKRGVHAGQLALAYLLAQPFPCYPIIGNTDPGRMQEALESIAIALTAEEIAELTG